MPKSLGSTVIENSRNDPVDYATQNNYKYRIEVLRRMTVQDKSTKHRCMMNVKYPQIEVQLTSEGGNVFNLIGIVRKALKKNDVEYKPFVEEIVATASYDMGHTNES